MASSTSNIIFDILAKDNASKVFEAVTSKAVAQEKAIKALRTAGTAQFVALAAMTIAFGASSVQAYGEAEKSQKQLAFAMAKFPKLAGTNIDALEDYNSALMKKTAIDDDVIASAEAMLAQFELNEKQLRTLTPLMLDYSVRTGKDLATSAEVMGKALAGQGRALKEVGIQFKDTGTHAGNFDQLVAGLTRQVGGFAENEAKSATGQAELLKLQFEELQETTGEKLLPALLELAEAGNETLTWIDENQGAATALAITVGVLSTGIAVAANWQKIHTTATTIATAAQWAHNAVLGRNVVVKAADAAASTASQLAITRLTASTAAATAATAANTAVNSANASSLGKVTKAAGPVMAVLAVMAASSAIPEWGTSNALGAQETVDALLKIADGAEVADTSLGKMLDKGGLKDWFTGNDVDSIERAYKVLKDTSVEDQVDNVISSVLTLGRATSTNRTEAEKMFRTLDEGLTALVAAGQSEKAAAALAEMGLNLEDAKEFLPSYADALVGLQNETNLATDATGGLTAVTKESIDAANEAADAVLSLVDAVQQQIDKQREAAGIALDENSAVRDYQEAIDAATAALTENGATLDINTKQGRDNQAALDSIASSTWDWVDAGSSAGVSQVDLANRMNEGRQAFIDSATAMGVSTEEANALADQMNLIPSNVVTNVALTGYASTYKYLSDIQAMLRSVTGDHSIRVAKGQGGSGGLTFSGGGPVYGPGTRTSDSILAALSNEEFVQTADSHNFWGTDFMWDVNRKNTAGVAARLSQMQFAGGGTPASSLIGGASYSGLSSAARQSASTSAAPLEATFNIYDVNGVLIGAMRAVAAEQSRAVAAGRAAAVRS